MRISARTKLRRKFRVRKVQNILWANFFMFILLISNHMVFLVRFGINLHLWVFQKAEIALTEAARAISAFWKTHSCKLIPNWTRNRKITYTNKFLHIYSVIYRQIKCFIRISKHQEESWKYDAQLSIFNEIQGVWIVDKHRHTSQGGRGRMQPPPPQLQKVLEFFRQNADDLGKSTWEKTF